MNAEAQFLQSRQARRLATSNQQEERQSRTDILYAFWAALKARLGQWKERLTSLETKYSSSSSSSDEKVATLTEEKKRTLHMELCQLEEELKYWKKLCLADTTLDYTSAMPLRSIDNDNDHDDDDDFLSLCPPDLPLSDVRLLHTHFSECQTRLDQVRKSLLPRGKFVFRRYREALLRQQQQQQQQASLMTESANEAITGPNTTTTKRHEYDDPDRTISNLKHVRLLVHTDGHVEYLDRYDQAQQQQQQLATPLSSLLLKNLEHCEITIDGPYQSLHLVSVLSSQVRLQHKVGGAIHVTNCHHCSLWTQSQQQLRLHDSSCLECHAQISSGGVILEDCTEIVFYYNRSRSKSSSGDDANATMNIKDFNWLKKVPSPNFRVEVEDEEDKPKTPFLRHEPTPVVQKPKDRDTATIINDSSHSLAKKEDDDDEL